MLGPHDVLAMIATSMDPLRFKAASRVATCVGHDCWKPEAKHVELEVGLNIEGLSMIGWLRHLSRPDANLARIAN